MKDLILVPRTVDDVVYNLSVAYEYFCDDPTIDRLGVVQLMVDEARAMLSKEDQC